MKKAIWMIPLTILALGLSSCGGDEAVKPDVDDQSGAQTTPADTGSSAGADLLSERRVYFEYDSSAIDGEYAAIVEAHAKNLSSNSSLNVTLEGHARWKDMPMSVVPVNITWHWVKDVLKPLPA